MRATLQFSGPARSASATKRSLWPDRPLAVGDPLIAVAVSGQREHRAEFGSVEGTGMVGGFPTQRNHASGTIGADHDQHRHTHRSATRV